MPAETLEAGPDRATRRWPSVVLAVVVLVGFAGWTADQQLRQREVDALLEEGRTTTDEAARIEIYTQVQEIVIDEAVEVYLTTPIEGLPHREEVTGYVYTPVMGSSPWFYETSLA